MKKYIPVIIVSIMTSFLLSACAVTPRVSTWESTKQFTKAQVFNAGLQAGGEAGYTTTNSDRESGTLSFTKKIAKGDMILSVRIIDENNIIRVKTTANFAGDIAIAGLHEEAIRNFHILLFRELNIAPESEISNVHIVELS